MKIVEMTVEAHFECDCCGIETATTAGVLPSGWKEIIKRTESSFVLVEVKKHFGPVCLNSNDPDVLQAIRNLIR